MKPSGVLNFENVPADAGDPDVKVYVNGSEVSAGGGGDSDFDTVKVTFVNNDTVKNLEPHISVIMESDGDKFIVADPLIMSETSEELDVVLYKGSADGGLYMSGSVVTEGVTVSGDIEYDDGYITITGNGTVTIAAGGDS